MKREELLFKLGEISDDIIEEAGSYAVHAGKQIPFPKPKRVFRRVAVGVAAVLVLTLGTFAAAMAVDEEFRDSVFAFFHIASADVVLPVEDEDPNWDDDVEYFYSAGVGDAATVEYIRISGDFKLSDGIICRYNDAERTSVSFYAYSMANGMIRLEPDNVETQYNWNGKTYDICFDWCEYGGHIGVYARYKESVNNAYWTVEPVSGRTDIVRLTFGGGRAFFFDLEAEAVIDPFAGCGVDELAIINTEFSPDLKKAFLACGHGETVWYCDTEEKTLMTVDELIGREVDGSWFIDSDTLGYYVMDSSYRYTYYARSLRTGDEQVILKVPLFGSHDSAWGIKPTGDRYGVLVAADASVYALDFKTGERNLIEGYTYPTDALTKTIPNETGDKIAFISYHNEETGLGISQIGVLDLNTRTFTLLDREGYEARHEASVSWFDEDRIFIWAVMENDNYLYLYTIPALLPPAGEFSYTERAGQTAVLTKSAALTDCYSYTQSTDLSMNLFYEWIQLDGEYALSEGDIVLVLGESDGMSRVAVPYGDVPRVYGYVASSLLSTDQADIVQGNQAVITDCDCYDSVEGNVIQTGNARVNIKEYEGEWAYVEEYATGAEPYWVRTSDLSFEFDEVVLDLPE